MNESEALKSDEAWMALALAEARKGVGLTSPNPPVGAVLVADGMVIGKGFHRKAGGPHAEIEAFEDAGWDISRHGPRHNATLYVTLEPCSTQGRTPPCVEAILRSGVSRVVWSVTDPYPSHSGRAQSLLERAGVAVTTGVLAKEGAALLRPWAHFQKTGQPWIIAKAATTLDGKITLGEGQGRWITSPGSREHAMRELRHRVDAILVGAETIRIDNPSLTVRGPITGQKEPLWRVVVTRSGHLPPSAQVFQDESAEKTLVFQNKTWKEIWSDLAGRGVVQVMVEGGGQVLSELFATGQVNEIAWYIAPILAPGGKSVSTWNGTFSGFSTVRLTNGTMTPVGEGDWFFSALVENPPPSDPETTA